MHEYKGGNKSFNNCKKSTETLEGWGNFLVLPDKIMANSVYNIKNYLTGDKCKILLFLGLGNYHFRSTLNY